MCVCVCVYRYPRYIVLYRRTVRAVLIARRLVSRETRARCVYITYIMPSDFNAPHPTASVRLLFLTNRRHTALFAANGIVVVILGRRISSPPTDPRFDGGSTATRPTVDTRQIVTSRETSEQTK